MSSGANQDRAAAQALADKINAALGQMTDGAWNYSRLRMAVVDLARIQGFYALGCDWIRPQSKAGREQLAELQREIEWGRRHSDDLSFLELACLRLNKALLEISGPVSGYWGTHFPVLRVMKRDRLETEGCTVGLWYEVEETDGNGLDHC